MQSAIPVKQPAIAREKWMSMMLQTTQESMWAVGPRSRSLGLTWNYPLEAASDAADYAHNQVTYAFYDAYGDDQLNRFKTVLNGKQ